MPTKKLTVEKKSQNYLIVEGALASVLFTLGTGNFLVGYLNYMGASAAFCALIVALPQLGCVLQLCSPFLFEKLYKKKGVIIFFCFLFRFSIGLTAFVPLIFKGVTKRLGVMFLIYFIAFMAAGFVTPGLNHWIMTVAPVKERGRYFAKKDICASLSNAVLCMLMGRQLDWFITRGKASTGYFLVFFTSVVLSCADVYLLYHIQEKESGKPEGLTVKQLLEPLGEAKHRKIILFLSIHSFAFNFSASFLVIYQLRSLELSHTFISVMGVGAAIVSIAGIWVWGKVADRYSFRKVLCYTGIGMAIGYFGWSAATPGNARLFAPVLQCIVISCSSSFNIASLNLQYIQSENKHTIAYLGITAAIANICGYIATLVSAGIQHKLEYLLGGKSISILLLISAIGILCNVLRFTPKD